MATTAHSHATAIDPESDAKETVTITLTSEGDIEIDSHVKGEKAGNLNRRALWLTTIAAQSLDKIAENYDKTHNITRPKVTVDGTEVIA